MVVGTKRLHICGTKVRRGQKSRRPFRVVCNAASNSTGSDVVIPSYWEFAERVNGRAAMQGFVWGSVNEAFTGNNVMEQLVKLNDVGGYDVVAEDVLNLTLVIAAVALGTAVTTFAPNEDLQRSSEKLSVRFTPDAELLNGRVAMIGFVMLVLFT